MMVTGTHGVRMQWDFTEDAAGLAGTVSAASPRWLRLTRAGDVISGYDSADGTHWTRVGTATLTGLPGHRAGRPVRRLARVLGDEGLAGRVVHRRAAHPGHRHLRPGDPAGGLARGRCGVYRIYGAVDRTRISRGPAG